MLRISAALLVLLTAAAAEAPPASWLPLIASGNLLFTPDDSAIDPNNMPQIGNGFLATQIMTPSIFVSGLYNGFGTLTPSHRARIPATAAISLGLQTVAAALNIQEAAYYRRSILPAGTAGAAPCSLASNSSCSNAAVDLIVEQRFYAHRMLSSLLVMEVQLLANDSAAAAAGQGLAQWAQPTAAGQPLAMLALRDAPGGPSEDIAFLPLPLPGPVLALGGICSGSGGSSSNCSLVNGSTLLPETNSSGLQAAAVLTAWPAQALQLDANTTMLPFSAVGQTAYFLTVVRTSIETADTAQLGLAALADLAGALQLAANGSLLSSHVAEMESLLWPAGLEVDSLPLAQVINASMGSLLGSVRTDRLFSISPGGLTNGYNGHVFWDCETWMLPSLAALFPDIGQALLEYRALRLPGAMAKAASYSPPYSGTMFPWESALTGEEVCPSWAGTGLREIHISADIAAALRSFWQQLGDEQWLQGTAWPMLQGIANFTMSRVALDNPGAVLQLEGEGQQLAGGSRHKSSGGIGSSSGSLRTQQTQQQQQHQRSLQSPSQQLLSIRGVIGPDEYHDNVTDSVYTNVAFAMALQTAAATASLLGQPAALYQPWLDVASRLVVLFNSSCAGLPAGQGCHPEFAGYTGDQIKQADVVLLGFPLQMANMTASARAGDLAYYLPRTDAVNGPAMSWGMYAVGYLELGMPATAEPLFNRSYANAHPPFAVWTETPTGGAPNFLTGAGGFLQVPLFGYAGLRLRDTAALFLGPSLPPACSLLRLRGLSYQGSRLTISISSSSVTVELVTQTAEQAQALRTRQTEVDELNQQALAGLAQALAQQQQEEQQLQDELASLSLLQRLPPLQLRSQQGQTVLDAGRRLLAAPAQLWVIDSAGSSYALQAGAEVTLGLGSFAVSTSPEGGRSALGEAARLRSV